MNNKEIIEILKGINVILESVKGEIEMLKQIIGNED